MIQIGLQIINSNDRPRSIFWHKLKRILLSDRIYVTNQTLIYRGRFFIVIGRRLWVRLSLKTGQFSTRFNYRSIMYATVGSLASSEILGPSTWVECPLEPLDLIVLRQGQVICTYTWTIAK